MGRGASEQDYKGSKRKKCDWEDLDQKCLNVATGGSCTLEELKSRLSLHCERLKVLL